MNNTFLKDMSTINDSLGNINTDGISNTMLKAAFILYYIDPISLELCVILKREVLPGSYLKTGRKLGLTALTVELPMDNPLTVEEAFAKLDLSSSIQNIVPLGSIMTEPKTSSNMYEMVLVEVNPPIFLDSDKGLIKQVKDSYEIGAVNFKDLLATIQDNFINDILTRMMLSELYIYAVEASQQQTYGDNKEIGRNNNGEIGSNGSIQPDLNRETPKTSDIPDEIIAQNMQTDFGAIYSRK